MTIAIICIAFITVMAIRFIWEAEKFNNWWEFEKDQSDRYKRSAKINWSLYASEVMENNEMERENDKLRGELAKYKRPRNPKTGRFL